MKHLQLFENFGAPDKLDALVSKLANDPDMRFRKLSLDRQDPNTPFLVWHNPQDDPAWRSSGYADGYDGDFSEVMPMNVLAFVTMGEQTYAYKLTPEEKTHGRIVSFDGKYQPSQFIKIETIDDLKRAFSESLWEMD